MQFYESNIDTIILDAFAVASPTNGLFKNIVVILKVHVLS